MQIAVALFVWHYLIATEQTIQFEQSRANDDDFN